MALTFGFNTDSIPGKAIYKTQQTRKQVTAGNVTDKNVFSNYVTCNTKCIFFFCLSHEK